MTKQFTDKLDKIIEDIYAIGVNDERLKVQDWKALKPGVRQQILAAIAGEIDKADPQTGKLTSREYWGNQLRQALGIEKGKSPTAQIFITNDLPTLLEKGEE